MARWRVLVVEEDRKVARLHCGYLARQPGFEVVGVAPDASRAVAMLGPLRLHLLVLDLELPGGDGLELLRGLRASGAPVAVPAPSRDRDAGHEARPGGDRRPDCRPLGRPPLAPARPPARAARAGPPRARRGRLADGDRDRPRDRVTRTTARRYLEYLVAVGEATVDEIPDGLGRPSKTYAALELVGAAAPVALAS